ncbi:MAG: right-handed parallel beta-helix repeat-containing protein, partial [Bacteroidota bacterium]
MRNFILTIIAVLFVLNINLFAQTPISGGTVNGTWTIVGSPYQINGEITIPDGTTLTIEPGVLVEFQGHYKLNVQGRLLAIGTEADTITFTVQPDSLATGWHGIRFDNTPAANDSSKIAYCKLQYGNATGSSPDYHGGAIYINSFSKLLIANNNISNNSTSSNSGYGGGIYCSHANPIIINNNITNNSADGNGGGICCSYANPIITNNTIRNNSTAYSGGGIYFMASSIFLSDNVIRDNYASQRGGGIYGLSSVNSSNISVALPFITNNIICNNTSDYEGGGFYCNQLFTLSLKNNTICNNSSPTGGGICLIKSTPLLINNTICNNSTSGIYCDESNPTLINTILYGNAYQVYLDNSFSHNSQPTFHNCNIEGGTGSFIVSAGTYTGVYSNCTDINPQFVSPSGGAGTGFDGVSADWQLQGGSDCIDAGAIWSRKDGDNSVADIGTYATTGYAATGNLPSGSVGGILSGTISNDTIIAEDIIIEDGQSLIISPGVTIFCGGRIISYGTLNATGTISDTIKFIGIENGFWNGIDFYYSGADNSQLSYCCISNSSSSGIFCIMSAPTFSNSTICNNVNYDGNFGGGGVSSYSASSYSLTNSIISNNAADKGGGVCCYSSSPTLTNNIISNNSAAYGGGFYCNSSYPASPTITNSIICNNSGFFNGGGIY